MIQELLLRRPGEHKPKPNTTIQLNEAVSVELQRGASVSFSEIPHRNTYHLEDAAERGIKPLTLADIIRQIAPALHKNLILFDTSPSFGFNQGNHFRLVKEDGKTKLQACAPSGFRDSKGVLPFEMPEDFAMFTGAMIVVAQRDNGKIVPLGEAQNYWQTHEDEMWAGESEVHYRGAITMWSNSEGEISTQLKLPLTSK